MMSTEECRNNETTATHSRNTVRNNLLKCLGIGLSAATLSVAAGSPMCEAAVPGAGEFDRGRIQSMVRDAVKDPARWQHILDGTPLAGQGAGIVIAGRLVGNVRTRGNGKNGNNRGNCNRNRK